MNIENQIEFNQIKEKWKELAITEWAKGQIHSVSVYLSEGELKKALQDTTDSRKMIDRLGTPPLPGVEEIRDILKSVEKGECLTPYQLERIERVLAAIMRLKDYLRRGIAFENSIAWYHENLDAMEELREEICQQIRNGAVDDYATKELQMYRINEENEVYQILYTLTAMVADEAEGLNENIKVIEKLDFLFSKGKLSIDLDAIEPSINTDRRIILRDARHPLMDKNINVPLQFETEEEIRGVVITGPNTGGKTVAIKTVMLNCMMAQCGLHVTCREADLCMNSSYLCDIGDGQNLAENLSTFSAHIKNVLDVLQEIDRDSLVVLDELGSGTDPAEGMGIAIAILEELRKSGCLFLVTTHYPEVKEYAKEADHIINARMTFDKETLRPTYQLVIGEAGESCAFYIAGRLGMSEEMLKVAAQAAYGGGAVSSYSFESGIKAGKQRQGSKIQKKKKKSNNSELRTKYSRGDSVMVFPDKRLGIVCEPVNEKGVLRVQLPDKKIWINHKRVKLHVAAAQLYPEDYDFSILFDSVENRKIRHEMERKYTEKKIEYDL